MKILTLLLALIIAAFNVDAQNHSIEKHLFKNQSIDNPLHQLDNFSSSHNKSNSRALVPLYDSIYSWKWDPAMAMWSNMADSRWINIVYDANNNLISSILQLMNGNSWQNSFLDVYTFDANNNQTSGLYQSWNGSSWVNSSLDTNTYDANNNRTSQLLQHWNGSSFDNYSLYTYTYDANNNQTSQLFQSWNVNSWNNNSLQTSTYDASNNQTSLLYQNWNGNTWVNGSFYTYTYDANNNQTSWLFQQWNGSSLDNYNLDTFTYDANNNQTSQLHQNWNGSSWENSFLYTSTYDANNNQTGQLIQQWIGSSWVNFTLYTYTYDANNFTLSEAYKKFDATGIFVWAGDSTYYYFQSTTVGIQETKNKNEFTIAPNPFKEQSTITFSSEHASSSSASVASSGSTLEHNIKILDITGREIKTQNFTGKQLIIEKENINPGIYFLQITNQNKQSFCKKIIIN